MKQREELVPPGVASAAEAVKGLRSPSLAPMNAANYKTVRVALDCLPRYGWKVHKGSCRSPLENGAGHFLFKPVFVERLGRGSDFSVLEVNEEVPLTMLYSANAERPCLGPKP